MIEEKEYIQFEQLNKYKNVKHLFTKKTFNFNKNYISDLDIEKQYNKIQNIINLQCDKIIKPIQTHTNIVKIVTKENINENFENVDGLITNLKNVALVTSLADCQGILIYDPIKEVIGNIHSGWRGTLNEIIKNAINIMIDKYSCNPKDIEAYICPSIHSCCFEVDEDVKNLFENKFKTFNSSNYIKKGKIIDKKQKYYIDTIWINKNIMNSLGIEKITDSKICTKCNHKTIHSYRADKNESGRNIAFIIQK